MIPTMKLLMRMSSVSVVTLLVSACGNNSIVPPAASSSPSELSTFPPKADPPLAGNVQLSTPLSGPSCLLGSWHAEGSAIKEYMNQVLKTITITNVDGSMDFIFTKDASLHDSPDLNNQALQGAIQQNVDAVIKGKLRGQSLETKISGVLALGGYSVLPVHNSGAPAGDLDRSVLTFINTTSHARMDYFKINGMQVANADAGINLSSPGQEVHYDCQDNNLTLTIDLGTAAPTTSREAQIRLTRAH